jgi:Tol biopolymer transport system component
VSHVTRDASDYSDLSLAANGQVLATVLSEGRWNLSIMPASSTGADVRPISQVVNFTTFTWMHDGRLLDDTDNSLHWINPDTGAKGSFVTQEDSITGNPWECSDGRYIVFVFGLTGGKGGQSIWRADSGGGNLKQLSNGKQDNFPVCSPDSRWVYYIDGSAGRIMKVSIEGGAPQKVGDLALSGLFDISPDGSTIAFATIDHANGHAEKLVLLDSSTGQIRKTMKFERDRIGYFVRFTRDGKSVVYPIRENGVDNLWQQPLDGTTGKQLTSFNAERIWDYHWSPDGSKLALVRGHTDSDIVLLRDMQQ